MTGKERFLIGSTVLLAVAGMVLFAAAIAGSLAPAEDASAPAVIDLSTIPPGGRRTVRLPGKTVFVLHRTAEQIESARVDDNAPIPMPQPDAERVRHPHWLVVEAAPENSYFPELFGGKSWEGRFGGWYAPYGEQHYDLSGRLREGSGATRNLPVPHYYFLDDSTIVIE